MYSKYLTTKNAQASNNVKPAYSLNLLKSFNFKDAQLITIVTEELIKNMVFSVASGTFKISAPTGHVSTPVLKKT